MLTKLCLDGPADQPLQETLDAYRQQYEKSKPANTVRQELWLLLSLFFIAFVLNGLMASEHTLLGFYTLPTLFSAYKYGRRHAVLTAFASVFLVVLLTHINPMLFNHRFGLGMQEKWFEIMLWGGILVITAYAMGTLYDRKESHLHELRESYNGILMILQHIASNDKYSQNHPYRVSVCATKIAERMELNSARVDDIRAAALLHDVDKLGISREILYKSANLTQEEFEKFQKQPAKFKEQPAGGSLRRVIPIVLAYQAGLDENGRPFALPKNSPVEARILAVADTYETLTNDPSSRLAPKDAIESIRARAGAEFDSDVVEAFIDAYQYGRMQMANA